MASTEIEVLIVDVLFESVLVPCDERPMFFEPPAIFHDISESLTLLAQYDVPLASEHILDRCSGSGI